LAETESVKKLRKLLGSGYEIRNVQPVVFASDVDVNIVIVDLLCPDGKKETIKAYGEQSKAVREYVRSLRQKN